MHGPGIKIKKMCLQHFFFTEVIIDFTCNFNMELHRTNHWFKGRFKEFDPPKLSLWLHIQSGIGQKAFFF